MSSKRYWRDIPVMTTKWRGWAQIDSGYNSTVQRTVYVETENDNYFEAESLLKTMYGNVDNVQRVQRTLSAPTPPTPSQPLTEGDIIVGAILIGLSFIGYVLYQLAMFINSILMYLHNMFF